MRMEFFYFILIFLEKKIIWTPVLAFALLSTGLYLMIRLQFMPIRQLLNAFQLLFKGKTKGKGEISPRAALCTALSATVGTGNIAGVATAIAIGGPGAVFWMWITAILGMATKYSECMLAVKYREKNLHGEFVGGPMYYIKNGLGKKWLWLGCVFAFCASIAGLGTGNLVQSYEVTKVIHKSFNIPPYIIGLVLSCIVFFVIIGGIKSIASIASKLVPLMAIMYFTSAVFVIILNKNQVPDAFTMIFSHAFTNSAAIGGFLGASFLLTMQMGADRGVFSNEAGQGTAPIAHASAKTNNPTQQGLIAMLGCFIDTLVICTLTALVILTMPPVFEFAGELQQYGYASQIGVEGRTSGASLTSEAFAAGLLQAGIKNGEFIVIICLSIFAFTTILGWVIYGERSIEFLFGNKAILPYRCIWCLVSFLGSSLVYIKHTQGKGIAWSIASISNGIMIIPNLLAIIMLSGIVVYTTRNAGLIHQFRFFQRKKQVEDISN